jgi:hypothetical protein
MPIMMKGKIIILIFAAILTSCNVLKLSQSGDAEKEFMSKFINCMSDEADPDYNGMMACISPKYIKLNKLKVADFKVNNYSVNGFNIESYTRTSGIIVVKVWGVERKWMHRLNFKIVSEKGKLYLYPSKNSDKYIDPWTQVDSYIIE